MDEKPVEEAPEKAASETVETASAEVAKTGKSIFKSFSFWSTAVLSLLLVALVAWNFSLMNQMKKDELAVNVTPTKAQPTAARNKDDVTPTSKPTAKPTEKSTSTPTAKPTAKPDDSGLSVNLPIIPTDISDKLKDANLNEDDSDGGLFLNKDLIDLDLGGIIGKLSDVPYKVYGIYVGDGGDIDFGVCEGENVFYLPSLVELKEGEHDDIYCLSGDVVPQGGYNEFNAYELVFNDDDVVSRQVDDALGLRVIHLDGIEEANDTGLNEYAYGAFAYEQDPNPWGTMFRKFDTLTYIDEWDGGHTQYTFFIPHDTAVDLKLVPDNIYLIAVSMASEAFSNQTEKGYVTDGTHIILRTITQD